MAIRSISLASMDGSISFGKRREVHGNSSNPLTKASVVTVIALSPMAEVQDAFALEPRVPRVEVVEDITQLNKPVPLPPKCKILKNVKLEEKNGGYMNFRLIDTDGDDSNYEMLEITSSATGNDISLRGILKGVQFSDEDKGVRISGIQLNTKNPDDYNPKGIMSVSYPKVPKLYAILNNIVGMETNNNAFFVIPSNVSYRHLFDADMKDYKNLLNIE